MAEVLIREQIRVMLEGKWPDADVFFPAFEYELMSKRRVELILQESAIDSIRYQKGSMNCIAFSLLLHAEVTAYRVLNYPLAEHMWSFGRADMMRKSGKRGKLAKHRLNIAVTTSGVYLVEPQSDKVWKARDTDLVYRVRF